MVRIVIEGLPQVGKSFYCQKLKNNGYIVQTNEQYHKNWTQWYQLLQTSTSLQMLSPVACQLQLLYDQTHLPYETTTCNIYERSPYTLKHIFGDMLYEQRKLSENDYQLQNNYIDELGWIPDVIIYLFCDLNIVSQRTGYNVEFLEALYLKHETILNEMSCRITLYKVNAQEEPDIVYRNIRDIIDHLSH